MNINLKNYLLFILLIVLNVACTKDDSDISLVLPNKTQTGEHTFGFLLNEKVWINYGQVCFPFAGGCRENLQVYYFPNKNFLINADKVLYKNGSWNTSESIDIAVDELLTAKTYRSVNKDKVSAFYTFEGQGQQPKQYLPHKTRPDFNVRITTLDSVKRTMSGEFNGTLFRVVDLSSLALSESDSIIIKDGRFDAKLK
ncbi:hypothetical protein [Arcicella rigui]|uniref:Uncharacterized protein n=1 Tax=Arcicella rigui TaxID=797020 RepID=A0ABU5QF40_9BACT|nr:hypothetical protein [Arcicella rigui]MEA5141480.1 hypothetical protein [Arcicella rigui]